VCIHELSAGLIVIVILITIALTTYILDIGGDGSIRAEIDYTGTSAPLLRGILGLAPALRRATSFCIV